MNDRHTIGDMEILLSGIPGKTSRGFLGYCTVVLFLLDGEWALFDTGQQADRHLLVQALSQRGLTPADIKHVVLSHLHFDHILNLPLFKRAKVYISQAELDYAKMVCEGDHHDPAVFDLWPELLKGREVHSFQNELQLNDSIGLSCLPGHTPGCLALFYQGNENIALCGDTIKNAWEAFTKTPAMVRGDGDEARSSIQKILQTASIVVPGHDRPFRHKDGKFEFLTSLEWQVMASFYPRKQEQTIYSINLSPGFGEEPSSE